MGRNTGSGQGSIFKSGNGWRGQIILGTERKSVSGKTKKEVASKLAKLRSDFDSGNYAKQSDITVEEWYKHWLGVYAVRTLSDETLKHLEGMFNRYLPDAITSLALQDLNRRTLEDFYEQYMAKYSSNTVRLFSVEFKKCLETAVDEGILVKNPHYKARLPKTKPPKKIFAYTGADQKKIVVFCKEIHKNDKYARLFYFLIGTGMRFGEATALTWNDVDLDTGRIEINKTVLRSHGGMIVKNSAKTDAGNRVIYVGENILEMLRSIKHESDLVFTNNQGRMISHTAAMRNWHKTCEKIGVPVRGLHSLRHTWATRALEAGVDVKTVSNMLGHTSVITTMNIYQDVFDTHKMGAACTLNALL